LAVDRFFGQFYYHRRQAARDLHPRDSSASKAVSQECMCGC
jgi:hypothetical protein